MQGLEFDAMAIGIVGNGLSLMSLFSLEGSYVVYTQLRRGYVMALPGP